MKLPLNKNEQYINAHIDAWSSGQMESKLWLCREVEKVFSQKSNPINIWILGGWYALSAFLLFSRENMEIESIRSFDLDPDVEIIADRINENWIHKNWKFKAYTADCNELEIDNGPYGKAPDLIINTSSEHFHTDDWWHNIPYGKYVAIQSNDMDHSDHHITIKNSNELLNRYPLSTILFQGELLINYDTWSFTRSMIIGIK